MGDTKLIPLDACGSCCQKVIMDEPGYGFYYDRGNKMLFHTECYEQYEEIPVEEVPDASQW